MAANASRSNNESNKRSAKAAAKVNRPAPATDLDKVIHERTRLALVSALAANAVLSFNDLKSALQVSDGNLSVHARKLEEAGYVECTKGYEGRVPRTEFRLTASGRAALQKYIAHMEALIGAMKNG